LETFQALGVKEINDRFTHFVNRYIQELFQICLREVTANSREASRIEEHLVIYACGGNGREQAFDDDFDLIIVIDQYTPEELDTMREVIAYMNSEMIKRGTLPHFRFSHHFGEYLCPYEGLRDLIGSDYSDNYIDKSQLLESRPLLGGDGIHQKFLQEIVKEQIFRKDRLYIDQMIREINQRHGSTTFFHEKCANIKECTGGLRDIEMIILIYKVFYKIMDTEPYGLLKKFMNRNKNYAKQWKSLRNGLLFLQRFRYVYRLSITAEDQIYAEGLDDVAMRLNPALPGQENPTKWLWNQFIFHRKEAWQALRQLIRELD
jgi:UTP:GlnB (protein PII) uridylyltransferase